MKLIKILITLLLCIYIQSAVTHGQGNVIVGRRQGARVGVGHTSIALGADVNMESIAYSKSIAGRRI